MDKVEHMDVYAMDRGIARLVSQMCNVELNPVAHEQYTRLKLDAHIGHGKIHSLGFAKKALTNDAADNIRKRYRRIDDWHTYQHTLALIEELLVEFETTTHAVHSHDVMVECLSQRSKDELIFQEPKAIKMNERTSLIADYLASQINRSYSTSFRDIGFRPDSYSFLSDGIYNKVGEYLKANNKMLLS